MIELAAAIAAFIVSHMLPAARPLRTVLIARLGKRFYLALYSVTSIAVLTWVGIAYARADYIEVWAVQPWMTWVPLLVMPLACVLLVATFLLPNPLSISARRAGFDPVRPGLTGLVRHPLMVALTLWAVSHMVANGDVASLVMFGLFAVLGGIGPRSIDARKRLQLGEEEWRRLNAGRGGFGLRDGLAVALGLVLYAGLLWAHPLFIGVSPLL